MAYGSTLVLTLSNPVTILAFAAIFAGLGVTAGGDHGQAALLVLGVFLGSAAWWVILSAGVSASRGWFNESGMRWVNRVAGVVIAGFGLAALLNALR
jgi:threonine/homoserine/homoserine lactone efflux protein